MSVKALEASAAFAADGRDPLDVTAGKIKACFDRADNQQITAGQLLLEARERVEAGEAGDTGWQAWCAANIDRSYRNLQRLIAVAKADDPQTALQKYRAAARERIRRPRLRAPRIAGDAAASALAAYNGGHKVRAALDAYKVLNRTQRLEFQRETKLHPLGEPRDRGRAYRPIWASSEAVKSSVETGEQVRGELPASPAKPAESPAPTPASKRALMRRNKPLSSRLRRLIATSWVSHIPEMGPPSTARGQDADMA